MLRLFLQLLFAAVLVTAASTQRNPIRSLQRIQNATIQTSTHRVNSLSRFDLDFSLSPDSSVHIRLSLEPNHDIIPQGAKVDFLSPDGAILRSEPIQKHHHKVFKGRARARQEDGTFVTIGTTRVTITRDGSDPQFEGMFSHNFDNHHILSTSNYRRTHTSEDVRIGSSDEGMILFRDSDMVPKYHYAQTPMKRSLDDNHTCYADSLVSNRRSDPLLFGRDDSISALESLRYGKRQIDNSPGSINSGGDLTASIGQTAGCPSTRKVALVGVATDCSYVATFNSSQAVRENVISIINSASGVFEDAFNISLGLQNLLVVDTACPGSVQTATTWNQACTGNTQILDQLNEFSSWRNTQQDGNSHWTLLTACQYSTAVGLAWVGRACTPATGTSASTANNETVAGANVVALTSTEWQVVAHETGHTFGAVHDCDSSTCADRSFVASGQCCPYTASQCDAGSQFIMNPYTIQGIDQFSPCTIGNICSAMGSNAVNSSCLSNNIAVSTITGKQCGNGIVEEDEQCDCGDAESCASDPCCDGDTCQYSAGSVCDDVNEDCCNQCQFSSSGTVCRSSTSSCDPEEVCSGSGGSCPADVTAPDGQSCSITNAPDGSGSLTCASGQCTSRNLQCMSVMGSLTSGSNDTYACDETSCTMSCGSPAFGLNTCYEMNRQLLDGTPCGGGGFCSFGTCEGTNLSKTIALWIQNNKHIFIPVVVVAGILVLAILFSCIRGCCRRSRRPKQMQFVDRPPVNQGWTGPVPPQGPYVQQGPEMQWPSQAWPPPHATNQPPPVWNPRRSSLYGPGMFDNLAAQNQPSDTQAVPPSYPRAPEHGYFAPSGQH